MKPIIVLTHSPTFARQGLRQRGITDLSRFRVCDSPHYLVGLQDFDFVEIGSPSPALLIRALQQRGRSRPLSSLQQLVDERRPEPKPEPRPRLVRHKKRGTTYEVLGMAIAQVSTGEELMGLHKRALVDGDLLVVYKGTDGQLWARFPGEFNDGRFEDV